MKKLLVTTLITLSCGTMYALPVGNPAEASLLTWGVVFPSYENRPMHPCCYWFDNWSLKVGFYGDYVFNRNLKLAEGGFDQGENIQKTQLFTNAGYLALNICNKLDVFATLGASRISITTNETSWFLAGAAEGRFDWDTFFSWSAGVHATLFQNRQFLFGVEGQYFQTDPNLSSYVSFSDGLFNYFNTENETRYREWQFGAGLSYALNCFCPNLNVVPYVAGKCAWSRFTTHDLTFIKTGTTNVFTIFDMKASKVWGLAVGTSLVICNIVEFNVEGRWADEKAFYVNGNFRF